MKPAAQRYEREPHAHTHKPRPQYQLEMGTKSLLAAFFALAIVCGLFFTFGYTIGKHAIPATFSLGAAKPPQQHVQSAPISPGVQPPNPQQLGAAETNQTPATLTNPAAAGSTSSSTSPDTASAQPVSTATPAASTATGVAASTTTVAPDSAAARNIAPPAVAPPSTKPTPVNSAPATASTAAASAANAQNGQLYEVQVFAGTSGDAGSLADALKTRGYPASVVSPAAGSGSNLFRVEVGPYLTRAEAQAMRSRLRADGYQAVLRIGQ